MEVRRLKNKQPDKKTNEYIIKNYRFLVESKFDEKARKIDDILIKLALNDLTNNKIYCKIDL